MKPNVGSIDRALRFIVGVAVLCAGYYYQSWWGLVGIVPLLTSVFRICPAYIPLGLSSCTKK